MSGCGYTTPVYRAIRRQKSARQTNFLTDVFDDTLFQSISVSEPLRQDITRDPWVLGAALRYDICPVNQSLRDVVAEERIDVRYTNAW